MTRTDTGWLIRLCSKLRASNAKMFISVFLRVCSLIMISPTPAFDASRAAGLGACGASVCLLQARWWKTRSTRHCQHPQVFYHSSVRQGIGFIPSPGFGAPRWLFISYFQTCCRQWLRGSGLLGQFHQSRHLHEGQCRASLSPPARH